MTGFTPIRGFRVASFCGLLALVLGLVGSAPALAAPVITEYSAGITAGAGPNAIANGPDRAMWFTEYHANKIGRIAANGSVSEYPTSPASLSAGANPAGIVTGQDGNIYFAEFGRSAIGELNASTGALIGEYPTPNASGPDGVAVGPDGAIWFAEQGTAGGVGRLDPATHAITEYSVHLGTHLNYEPTDLVKGPDGALWITLLGTGQIARLNPAAASPGSDSGFTIYNLPSGTTSGPEGITVGTDGNLYVAEYGVGKIAQIDPTVVQPGTDDGIAEYAAGGKPLWVSSAGDGGIWATDNTDKALLRFDPVTHDMQTFGAAQGVTGDATTDGVDSAGNLWFTEFASNKVGEVATSPQHTLTVKLAGPGTGSVTGSGISCGGGSQTCSLPFAPGTSVTLTETPLSGSVFAGWTGGGCSATASTCTVTLNADIVITATFNGSGPVPKNTHQPVIDGTPSAGKTLLCENDTWNTFGKAFFAYAWFETVVVRGPGGGIMHQTTEVASKLTKSFLVPDYPPGATLYCTVTATNANGSSVPAVSPAVTIVATIPVLAPNNAVLRIFTAPVITPTVTSTLVHGVGCLHGTWLHYPTKYRYQWYVLPTKGSPLSAGSVVSTTSSLRLTQTEFGQWVVCRVTASNAAGAGIALSARYYAGEPDYGVHVNAIEITQGIQTSELPTRSPTNGAAYHVAYSGVNLPWQAAGAAPVTVELAQDHRTVVRVYVNTQIALRGYGVPSMVLMAFRNGRELAPGPIEPDQTPPASAVLQGNLGVVTSADRVSRTSAYTFTLPQGSSTSDDWTSGDVEFEAQANPGPGSTPPCSLSCEERTLILDGTHFNQVTAARLDPLAIEDTANAGTGAFPNGYLPSGYDPAWNEVQAVVPFALFVPPYKATLNETGAVIAGNATATSGAVEADVQKWADSNDNLSSHYPFGVVPAGSYATIRAGTEGFSSDIFGNKTQRILYGDAQPISEAQENQPLTGLAHEFNHGLGRVHAGQTCGSNSNGQVGESWPPVNDGALDGIGLDTNGPSPYRIIQSTTANPVYDLMSYCPSNVYTTNPSSVPTYEADHWISVRNWNRDVAFRAPGPTSERDGAATAGYRTSPPATTAGTRTLAVMAVYDVAQQHGAIIDVSPDAGAPTVAHAGDTYSFVARNAAGAVVATAGALGSLGHVDFGSPDIVIVGKIPAAGVREIDLLQNGTVIATDHASAHTPTASVSSPSRGQRVGGPRGAVLRWRSHDADGGNLTVTVNYSSNGGRTWTTIYTGPDTGSVNLPSRMLSASRNARLREYVSDGFNEAIVTSPRFVALGAPPLVAITAPLRNAHVSAGGALDLAGSAYDDTGDRLTGRALTWRVGRQVIGRGTNVVTVALPGGRYDITLTARDRRGRTATASVRVIVMPSPPVISLLHAPRRVSSRAHSFTLRIASLAPTTLTIGRKRVLVGRAAHKVRVKVAPGRKALTFILRLRSGRFTTAIPIRVIR